MTHGLRAMSTPGPWKASCDDDTGVANEIRAADGAIIATVHDCPRIRARLRRGKVEGPGSTAGPDALDEVDANARLIAAAPDLLAALRGMLDWYGALPEPGRVPDGLTLSARLRAARAALALAEGGAA